MIGLLMLTAGLSAPLIVAVDGPPCSIELNGSPIASEALPSAITKLKGRRFGVVIRHGPNIPYRCMGGVIFDIQRAGVRRITFDPPFPNPAAP